MSLNLLPISPKKTTEMQIICSGVDGTKVQLWQAITRYRTRISENGLRGRIEMWLLFWKPFYVKKVAPFLQSYPFFVRDMWGRIGTVFHVLRSRRAISVVQIISIKMAKTRSRTEHYVLGQPSPLPTVALPTKGEVINYMKWIQEVREKVACRTPDSSIFRTVATEVGPMWNDEGIPTYDHTYVVKRLRVEYSAYQKTDRQPKIRRQGGSKAGQQAGRQRFSQLFDIARCKCKSLTAWSCSKDCRIPENEWPFIQDQRGDRRLSLGACDRATTALREARL